MWQPFEQRITKGIKMRGIKAGCDDHIWRKPPQGGNHIRIVVDVTAIDGLDALVKKCMLEFNGWQTPMPVRFAFAAKDDVKFEAWCLGNFIVDRYSVGRRFV